MTKKKQKQPSLQDIFQNGARIPYLHITFVELIILVIILGVGSIFIYFSTSATTDTENKQTQDTQASEAEPDIIEGGRVEQDMWPFMGRVYTTVIKEDGTEGLSPGCSSTLIHPRFVLSAAHCNYQAYNFQDDTISYHLQAAEDIRVVFPYSSQPEHKHTVRGIFRHPLYNYLDYSTNTYDIVLIELETPVTNITPVALWEMPDSPAAGTRAIGLGWGGVLRALEERNSTELNIVLPDDRDLREAIMRTLSRSEIRQFEPQDDTTYFITTFPNYICYGDSGGPLLVWNTQYQRMEQVGVLAHFLFSNNPDNLPNWATDDFNTQDSCLYSSYAANYAPLPLELNPQGSSPSNILFIQHVLSSYQETQTEKYVGVDINQLHCHVDDPGSLSAPPNETPRSALEGLPRCVSDQNQAYWIRRGCSDQCVGGYENCRYGENGEYIGCQPIGASDGYTPASEDSSDSEYSTLDLSGSGSSEDGDRGGDTVTCYTKEFCQSIGAAKKCGKDDTGSCSRNRPNICVTEEGTPFITEEEDEWRQGSKCEGAREGSGGREEEEREEEPIEEEEWGNVSWYYYWDVECVCSDSNNNRENPQWISIGKEGDGFNNCVDSACPRSEFSGEPEAYWDKECVRTDNAGTYEKVEGLDEGACNDRNK